MSEHRYFYTDPLAAAWMAKHFGMRFERGIIFHQEKLDTEWGTKPGEWYCLGEQEWLDENDIDSDHPIWPNKIYIHADGIHILDSSRENIDIYLLGEIIQRNGIPFMWPESE